MVPKEEPKGTVYDMHSSSSSSAQDTASEVSSVTSGTRDHESQHSAEPMDSTSNAGDPSGDSDAPSVEKEEGGATGNSGAKKDRKDSTVSSPIRLDTLPYLII